MKDWKKLAVMIGLPVAALIAIACSAGGSVSSTDSDSRGYATASESADSAGTTTGATAAPVAEQPEQINDAPTLTMEQRAAIESAESYLRNVGGFSRSGLIGQLEYEGFSNADATFAVDSLNVDWNAQAAESAASYIRNVGGFSRDELIRQLEYEGFTHEQAVFGAEANGY